MKGAISIRRTAFVWLAGLMAAIGICAAAGSYLLARKEAADFLDNQLRQVALYVGDAPFAPGSDGGGAHDPEDDFIVQVWDAAGGIVRQSHPAIAIPPQAATGFQDLRSTDGDWRVYTLTATSRTVQVSQRMDVRQELAASAALQAALPIIILIPLSLLTLGWIIDRIMARLDRLAISVASRNSAADDPVPIDDVPDEVIPFVSAINQSLSRLRALLDQQRRFISDAAHELRTPLSALQVQIDNLRHNDRDGRFAQRLADIEAGLSRATSLVGKLLRLARYDALDAVAPPQPIDLVQLAVDTVARLTPLAESRSIDLGITRRDEAVTLGVPADLEIILANLVENAVRYTPPGGSIDIAVETAGHEVRIEVSDTGPGIREEELDRVFERFFRGRPLDVEGSGLGLAIARAAARKNNARLTLANRQDRSGLVASLVVQRIVRP